MEDEKIIALYWNRDEAAIRETDAKYGPYCFSVAAGILNSFQDCEECVSDTWLHAWNSMPPQRPALLRIEESFLRTNADYHGVDVYKAPFFGANGTAERPMVEPVILDRPFVYLIVDTATMLPVFIGTEMDILAQ